MRKIFSSLSSKDKTKVILLSLVILACTITFSILASILQVLKGSPETDLDNLSLSFNQTSSIFLEDGTLLEKIESEEFRTVVSLEQVPKDLVNAFVSIEDQRFYNHNGIDLKGIAGSLLDNLKSRKIVRGGSTITQQLVKNVYLTNEKSLERKLREAYLSLRIDNSLPKDEILEAYLNRINLGQGAYGVQGAAQTYFSKDVNELSLAQCALLAGIAKSPSEYQPFLRIPTSSEEFFDRIVIGTTEVAGIDYTLYFNPASLERQKIVLNKMLELGYINEGSYQQALSEDIMSGFQPIEKKKHNMSSYALDFIKSQATEELATYYKISEEEAEHKLFTGGYQIFSTVDTTLQQELEDVYTNFSSYINSNTSSKGGAKMLQFSKDNDGNILDSSDEILYFYKNNILDDSFRYILSKNSFSFSTTGDLEINRKYFSPQEDSLRLKDCYVLNEQRNLLTYTLGNLNIPPDHFRWTRNNAVIDVNFLKENPDFIHLAEDSLAINPDFYDYDPTPVIQPQSSTIVVDNSGGYVKAIVGGLDIQSKYAKILNRASMSVRQPGTALTPFSVYLPALSQQMTLATSFDDSLQQFQGEWWPKNPSGQYLGYLTLRNAFQNNSFSISSQVLQKISFTPVLNSLSSIDIFNSSNPKSDRIISSEEDTKNNDYTVDALALGNLIKGVTNLELTSAYMTLANNGVYREPKIITEIKDATGLAIIKNGNDRGHKAYSPEDACIITDMLRTNTRWGTAHGVALSQHVTAANVGINKFNSDLWLTGYTPNYTIGTWIGCDSPKISLNSSSETIVDLWKNIAKNAHKNISEVSEFTKPDTVREVYICGKSGKLATKQCEYASDSYFELFKIGEEPKDYCQSHISLNICAESNGLITKYCPEEEIYSKTYFKRDNPYNGKENPGIYPRDFEKIPSTFCDIHTRDWYDEQEEDNSKKSNSAKGRSSSETSSKSKNSKKN